MKYIKGGKRIYGNRSKSHKPDQKKLDELEKEFFKMAEGRGPDSKLIAVRIPTWLDLTMRMEAEAIGLSYSHYLRGLLSWKYQGRLLLMALNGGQYSPKEMEMENIIDDIKLAGDFLDDVKAIKQYERFVLGVLDEFKKAKKKLNKILERKSVGTKKKPKK